MKYFHVLKQLPYTDSYCIEVERQQCEMHSTTISRFINFVFRFAKTDEGIVTYFHNKFSVGKRNDISGTDLLLTCPIM